MNFKNNATLLKSAPISNALAYLDGLDNVNATHTLNLLDTDPTWRAAYPNPRTIESNITSTIGPAKCPVFTTVIRSAGLDATGTGTTRVGSIAEASDAWLRAHLLTALASLAQFTRDTADINAPVSRDDNWITCRVCRERRPHTAYGFSNRHTGERKQTCSACCRAAHDDASGTHTTTTSINTHSLLVDLPPPPTAINAAPCPPATDHTAPKTDSATRSSTRHTITIAANAYLALSPEARDALHSNHDIHLT